MSVMLGKHEEQAYPAEPGALVPLLVDAYGRLITTSDARYGGEKTTSATTLNTSGDNVILTPTAGKAITLYWIDLNASADNSDEVIATVKMGATTIYIQYLGPQAAFMHWEPIVGAVNAPLIVNLSASAQLVAVNFTTTES